MFETKINFDHFMKVIHARRENGIFFERDNEIKNSPLKNKKMFCSRSGKEYTVDKVIKQWHKGYYIALALVDANRSHKIIFWENLNCIEPIILNSIEENNLSIFFLDESHK